MVHCGENPQHFEELSYPTPFLSFCEPPQSIRGFPREEGQVLGWRRLTNLTQRDTRSEPSTRQDYHVKPVCGALFSQCALRRIHHAAYMPGDQTELGNDQY